MQPVTQAYCNSCRIFTRHEILGSDRQEGTDTIDHLPQHEMLRCCGCEAVKMRVTGERPVPHGLPPEVTYYPPALERREPDWLSRDVDAMLKVPNLIFRLMTEIYMATQYGLRRLAGMGIRA